MPTSTIPITNTLTELLSHLVRMPTVSEDRATNRAALDWVETQLAGLPLDIKRFDNAGFAALAATTPAVANPKQPKLWLAAHIDVVAGSPDDFVPAVKDGRIYGRGTHDMKYAIASYLALFHELGASLGRYDLGLLLTSDEEIGGERGIGWLVNDRGYRGGAVLLPDTSIAWQAEMASKGIMRWQLGAAGKAAHAARPWQGVNAVDELMRAVNLVRANVPAEPCGDPQHRHATVNLSQVIGGEAINLVPKSATALLDVRFPSDLTFDAIAAWFEAAIAAVPSVSSEILVQAPPFKMESGPAMEQFKTIARKVAGRDITFHNSHASSDARWFAWKNIPVINIGIAGSGYHTSPEWVDLANLTSFYEVVRQFVNDYASN